MHLPLLKAFGWNDRRIHWTGPSIQMEMNSSKKCMMCGAVEHGNQRRLWGLLALSSCVYKERGSLYAVDWRAQELTEQIDNPALRTWALIYPETIDQETLVKNNNSQWHNKIIFNVKWSCSVKLSSFLSISNARKPLWSHEALCLWNHVYPWRPWNDSCKSLFSLLSPLLFVPLGFPSSQEEIVREKKNLSYAHNRILWFFSPFLTDQLSCRSPGSWDYQWAIPAFYVW